ncbi:MAG TPA: FHA domain-containing protein [Candidatus Didemnitutus sp.]|jgi:pSer/pThr/pTyr-binding forkhead associated (FHA) protein
MATENALPTAWLELPDGRMLFLEGPFTIGRSATSTLVLDQAGVSRSHAMVQPGPGGGHLLADLRSTNGTYVNGLRLEQARPLRDGDTILVGEASLIYRCRQEQSQATDSSQTTSVQIYSGPCWLLLLDVIGFTTHTQKVGNHEAAEDFKKWLEVVRPVLARQDATINSYLGDAIFSYWRQDRHPPEKIAQAVRELVAAQADSPLPFRMLVHHGHVRISGGLQGESLSGSDVIFLFRIEKSTKPLGSPCVLSATATQALRFGDVARPLGSHAVPDFERPHEFFGMP